MEQKGEAAVQMQAVLLDTRQLAALLGVSPRTIEDRRRLGMSLPRNVKIGKLVKYRPKDVELWLDSLQEEQEVKQASGR